MVNIGVFVALLWRMPAFFAEVLRAGSPQVLACDGAPALSPPVPGDARHVRKAIVYVFYKCHVTSLQDVVLLIVHGACFVRSVDDHGSLMVEAFFHGEAFFPRRCDVADYFRALPLRQTADKNQV